MVTAFVLESYKSLEPTSDDSADLRTSPSVLSSTNPRTVAVRVNVFWFSSLVASVSTAFLAVLTKEWLSDLLDGRNDPHIGTRGRRLQHCHDSVQSWRLSQLLPFLPFLLHISFLLFFAGLVTFLWYIDRTVAIFAAVLVCAMTFVYCWTHVQSILSPSCPYKTSLTSLILSSAGSLWTVFVWHIPAFLAKMWVVIAMVRRSRKYGDHQFVHVAWDVVVMSWFRGWWKRSIPALRDALPASEGIMPPEVTALGPANIFRLREDEFLSENATLLNARALARILIVLRHPRTRLRVDDKRLSLALKEL
ncbi:hypothetical protein EVJ58_g2513 [Rhodofomes roseus]|nr:hypothetical protein EVJ58_g2513 [Rhodofomes roseus]